MRKYFGYGGLAVLVALLGGFVLWQVSPRVKAFYYLYYGSDAFETLFHDGLGLDKSSATLLSALFAFLYIAALIGVARWSITVFRNFSLLQFAKGLFWFVLVYATAPLAHIIFDRVGPLVCFNQTTGEPLKWYVIRSGAIIISNEPGFDTVTKAGREPITPEICRMYQEQQTHVTVNELSYQQVIDLAQASNGSLPRAWFYQKNGTIKLYSSPVIIPGTDELIKPITTQILLELKQQVEVQRKAEIQARQERDRAAAAAEEAKRRADEKAARDLQAADEARKKDEQRAHAEKCQNVSVSACKNAFNSSSGGLSICQTLAECDPKNPAAWSLLGRANLQLKNLDAAGAAFDHELELAQALQDDSIISEAYANLGAFEKARGTLDRSEAFYLKGIELSERSPLARATAYTGLSEVYLHQGNFNQAETYLQNSISILSGTGEKSQLALAYFGLGFVSMQRQNYFSACLNFRQALALFREANSEKRIIQTNQAMKRANCWGAE